VFKTSFLISVIIIAISIVVSCAYRSEKGILPEVNDPTIIAIYLDDIENTGLIRDDYEVNFGVGAQFLSNGFEKYESIMLEKSVLTNQRKTPLNSEGYEPQIFTNYYLVRFPVYSSYKVKLVLKYEKSLLFFRGQTEQLIEDNRFDLLYVLYPESANLDMISIIASKGRQIMVVQYHGAAMADILIDEIAQVFAQEEKVE